MLNYDVFVGVPLPNHYLFLVELKVLFYLKKNQTKKNGLCPVMGRINVGKTMAQFSLKIDADVELWDTKAGRLRGKSQFANGINSKIEKVNLLIYSRYNEMLRLKQDFTASDLKVIVQGIADAQESLLSYFRKMNEKFSVRVGKDRAKSTLKSYEYYYDVVAEYLKKEYNRTDIAFPELNYSFIEHLVHYLLANKKYALGTVTNIVNRLRELISEVIDEGIIGRDPFFGFELEAVESKHRNISREDLENIMTTEFEHETTSVVRDMFVFSCFCGLAFIDVKNLTFDNVVKQEDGSLWIMVDRQKTGNASNIRLMGIPLSIIEKYRNNKNEGKMLPMPEYDTTRYHLRIIDAKCEINRGLSYHMARHTFASLITLSEGVPIETVSKMLGHKSITTTQRYAEVSKEKVLNDILELSGKVNDKYCLIN